MTEAQLLSLVASLSAVILGGLKWIGSRIFEKLDALSTQITEINASLQRQITDGDNILHGRINELDRRVTRVETKCSMEHGALK